MIEVLAWPAAVVVLGFGFMIGFRRPIAALLDRTKKLSKGGLETFDTPQIPAPGKKPDPLSEFLQTYDNPLLRDEEARIRDDLERRGLTEPAAAQRALVRALAGTNILIHFERVHAVIWASQIAALTYLNSRPNGVPLEELRPFYDDAKGRYPEIYERYPIENWLGFLQSWLLTDRTGDLITLSAVGREFLKWRIEIGRAGPFHL